MNALHCTRTTPQECVLLLAFITHLALLGQTIDRPQPGLSPETIREISIPTIVDYEFANRGGPNGPPSALALQPNGQIWIANGFTQVDGQATSLLVRLNPDGSLDPSFQIAGTLTGRIEVIVPLNDGILIGGSFTLTAGDGSETRNLARLNQDGQLASGFHARPSPNHPVTTIARDSQGNLLIGSDSSASRSANPTGQIVRLLPEGHFDPTFESSAQIQGRVQSLALQSNGNLILAGNLQRIDDQRPGRLARLDPEGTWDPTFESPIVGTVLEVLVLDDDSMLVVGDLVIESNFSRHGIVKLNPNGTLDATFPRVTTSGTITHIRRIDSNHFVIAGHFGITGLFRPNLLGWITRDGSVEGTLPNHLGNYLGVLSTFALDRNNRPIVAMRSTDYQGAQIPHLTRFHFESPTQPAFDIVHPAEPLSEGIPSAQLFVRRTGDLSQASSVHVRIDSASALANEDFESARHVLTFNPDERDKPFPITIKDDLLAEPDENLRVLLEEPSQGTILGLRDARIRINDNDRAGSLDETFQPDIISPFGPPSITGLVVQSDNRVIITGDFIQIDGIRTHTLARLNPGGSLDRGYEFRPPENTVSSIALHTNDALLVAGNHPEFGRLFRLDQQGRFDPTFKPRSKDITRPAVGFDLLPDGRILISGTDTDINTLEPINRIAILHPDGSRDESFDIGDGPNGIFRGLLFQAPDTIIVYGEFTEFNGTPTGPVVRLNLSGETDESFRPLGDLPILVYRAEPAGANWIKIEALFGPDDRIAYIAPDGRLVRGTSGPPVEAARQAPIGATYFSPLGVFSSQESFPITRHFADRSVDPEFDSGHGFQGLLRFMVQTQSGDLLVGGRIESYNGIQTASVIRVRSFRPFRIRQITTLGSGSIQIDSETSPGYRYHLERSSAAATWERIESRIATANTIPFEVDGMAHHQIYRVVQE